MFKISRELILKVNDNEASRERVLKKRSTELFPGNTDRRRKIIAPVRNEAHHIQNVLRLNDFSIKST